MLAMVLVSRFIEMAMVTFLDPFAAYNSFGFWCDAYPCMHPHLQAVLLAKL